ncbi:MAG: CHAP domain-containing protein, partial [Sorangiineae bacterium PRO1]|nr:CHAP domain-containing protein [Sorangiineae bacterium PRO1]
CWNWWRIMSCSTGASVTASATELGLKASHASGTETHRAREVGDGAEVPGSPTADAAAPAPVSAPQGGLAATTVADALSASPAEGLEATSTEIELRAGDGDGQGGQPVQQPMPTSPDAERQEWGCWMAGSAAHAGVPPSLPLMLALSRSGMHNLPADGSTAGFFGIEAKAAGVPPGHGLPASAQPDASWWAERPDAQLAHVLRRLREVSGGTRELELGEAQALERWAQDAGLAADGQRIAEAHEAANAMVSNCADSGGSARSNGEGGALGIARSQLGVHEAGVNAGPEVNRFLAAADTAPGSPWCASFVTWSLEQDGREMPGQGWAAVQRWVSAASAGEHGLSIVDAAHARPGDIVAYDWGGGSDFGQDGHIGFLESEVRDGRFTAVEGNANDAVSRMQRGLDQGNVVFIRVDD